MAKTSTAKGKKGLSPASKLSAKRGEKPKTSANGCSKISDAKLASNVLKAIAKIPRFKSMEIHIAAKTGTITLTGTTSDKFKATAGSAAKSVKCVKRVINKIKLPPPSFGCDPNSEIECFCNGVVRCIPIGQDCPDCNSREAG